MPSFAKFDTSGGKLMSSAKRPRPLGPSVRAVMTLVPTPIIMTATCAAKMPSESRANWPRLATPPSPGRGERRLADLGLQRVEREPVLPDDGPLALLRQKALPEPRDGRLEGIARRVEPVDVHRDVRRA